MKLIQIDHNPSLRQLRVFGFVWLVFFSVVGKLVLESRDSVMQATLIWSLAAAIPIAGWAFPAFMKLVYIGMSYAAFPIGFVVSCLILAIVYYLVLTPIGLGMRLCGYDPMRRKFDSTAETYWCIREQDDALDTYFRQF